MARTAANPALRHFYGPTTSVQPFRSESQPIHHAIHTFGLLRNTRRPDTAGPFHDRAVQRHDVFVGLDADVAVLQQVLAHEALMNPSRDPGVGHHFAGSAQAFLRFRDGDLGALDDSVLRLLGAFLGLVT